MDVPATPEDLPDLAALVRDRTPARLLVGRVGTSYPTDIQLALREDHASAVDAVQAEFALSDLGPGFAERWGIFEVRSRARDKTEYLLRPDLGRRLDPEGAERVARSCPQGANLQIVIGDGLSPTAVAAQVPALLPRLDQGARDRGWTVGRPFAIRYCRVGVLNDIGAILDPTVVVLLIGERPGLATSDSLSAYLAYQPRHGHTDAHRNLLSNIHARGIAPSAAAARVLRLADQMLAARTSGVAIKETGEGDGPPPRSVEGPSR